MRGNERQMVYELAFLLKEAGDPEARVDKTHQRLGCRPKRLGPRGKPAKVPRHLAGATLRVPLRPRIIPIQKVGHTNLEEIKAAAADATSKLAENEASSHRENVSQAST